MSVRAALGSVIKARRIELGWTQEQLAERISADGEYVRQSEISRIENGRIALPRRERLERLAQVLELPLGELLARSGWAGAEPHFGPAASEVDVTPPLGGPLNGSDALLTATDVTSHAPEAGQPPLATTIRSSNNTYDVDAIAAFRRALATMREESDRLQHNRTVTLAIQQRIGKVTNDDRELQAEADYSSSAGG
jgi:transcriptional regulator with XRE-family HTH domain